MEARELLKQLKDDGWYLGDTGDSCRQYVHPKRPGVFTVCVRYTDELGPGTEKVAMTPAESLQEEGEVVVENTRRGASAYVDGVTGCIATGQDEAEVRPRLAKALSLHRRALERIG